MTTTTATPPTRMAYVPGSMEFTHAARAQRTERYQTFRFADKTMGWGFECLLCGDWRSGYADREAAVTGYSRAHAGYCHVINGCHCSQPHLTAALAARIGVKDYYPYALAGWLFALAGGVRRYLPPQYDLNHVPFGGPEFGSGGYRWTRR